MGNSYRILRAGAAVLFLCGGLSGCAAVVLGGAAGAAGVSVAQERTTRQALDDVEIRVTINNKLSNDTEYGLFADVSTEVVEGRVLLTGEVNSPEARIRAAEIVWSTDGVVELANELTVGNEGSIGAYADDVWISAQIRGKLLTDRYIASINYYIETVHGVVHVTGIARSEYELDRALRHAASVDGVTEVVSHVLLKFDDRRPATPTTMPDQPAKREIE